MLRQGAAEPPSRRDYGPFNYLRVRVSDIGPALLRRDSFKITSVHRIGDVYYCPLCCLGTERCCMCTMSMHVFTLRPLFLALDLVYGYVTAIVCWVRPGLLLYVRAYMCAYAYCGRILPRRAACYLPTNPRYGHFFPFYSSCLSMANALFHYRPRKSFFLSFIIRYILLCYRSNTPYSGCVAFCLLSRHR